MKVFIFEFEGLNRFTGKGVVIAESLEEAKELAQNILETHQTPFGTTGLLKNSKVTDLTELDLTTKQAIIQWDGDY